MLNKEKNLTKSAYYTFNDAVNEIFFSGKFAHKLVYLDFEDVVSNELARRLNIPSNDLSAYIGKAVSDNLSITGNPYKEYIKTLNFWYAVSGWKPASTRAYLDLTATLGAIVPSAII